MWNIKSPKANCWITCHLGVFLFLFYFFLCLFERKLQIIQWYPQVPNFTLIHSTISSCQMPAEFETSAQSESDPQITLKYQRSNT